MASRSRSRQGSKAASERSQRSQPDSANLHPDPEAGKPPPPNYDEAVLKASSRRESRASSKASHHTAAEQLSHQASRAHSKASLASHTTSSTGSTVSEFGVAEAGAPPQGFVSKRTLYVVVGMAIVAVVVAALIGFFSAPRGSSAASPTAGPTTAPTSAPPPTPPAAAYFLPKTWTPSQYTLSLKVNMPDPMVAPNDTFKFTGNWSAMITCSQPASSIVMSLANLVIQPGSVAIGTAGPGTSNSLSVTGLSYKPEVQQVSIGLSGTCTVGQNYTLSFVYSGVLETHLYGFYRSRYMENGAWRYMAVTQMQPTDARRAFPCWDEPAFKANFSLQLTAPAQYQALGNGERLTNNVTSGWRTTTFTTTPRMSTYLVAFSVLDFDYVERRTSDGTVRFRIWARKSLKPYLNYAADIGAKVLQFYAQRFGMAFPLPKQDMLACPDFGLGAMENWGLVTYREQSIIYKDSTAPNIRFTSHTRQAVATTITHELSHQWFGDLVTMAWWNDAFLNEGMATLIENIGADGVSNGTFHLEEQFPVTTTQRGMDYDESLGSRPVAASNPPTRAATATAINTFFDDITYEKGGSLMRMISYTLGSATYTKGLSQYLRKWQYSNPNHKQYFAALTKVAGGVKDWNGKALNVTTFMDPWVEQSGFPLVTANRSGNVLTLTQSRFLVSRAGTPQPNKYNYLWYIPVWYQAGSFVSQLHWVQPGQATKITLSGQAAGAKFLVLNYGVKAFYRSHYDNASWTAISQQLHTNYSAIDVRNRAQIVNDVLTLAKAGTLPYGQALGVVSYLAQERSYIPWRAADATLVFLDGVFSQDPHYGLFRQYMLQLVGPAYRAVGWGSWEATSDVLSHYARRFAVHYACRYEDPDCVAKAAAKYATFKTQCAPFAAKGKGSFNCTTVAADLRQTVYCSGVAQGSSADYSLLWTLYLNEQVQDERMNLLYGLACTRETWLVRRLLGEALAATNIRSQDVRTLMGYLSGNPVASQLLWSFLTTNWASILDQYGQSFGNYFIRQIVGAATSHFHTKGQIAELESFMSSNALGGGAGAFRSALAKARTNQAWAQTYYAPVLHYINSTVATSQWS